MTLVDRNRPVRRSFIPIGDQLFTAIDPPKYTRAEVAKRAKHLRWKFTTCKDLENGRDNKFVRFMVKWWGELLVCQ